MRISDERLRQLEALARLELGDDEREGVRRDLEALLGHFHSLAQVDTAGVEEMVRPVPGENVLRGDEVRDSLPAELVEKLAVATEDGWFRVPRMIEGD